MFNFIAETISDSSKSAQHIEQMAHSETWMIIAQFLTFAGTLMIAVFQYLSKKDSKNFEQKREERENKKIQDENNFKLAQAKLASLERIELARMTASQMHGVQQHVTEKAKEVSELVSESKKERAEQLNEIKTGLDEVKQVNLENIEKANNINEKIASIGVQILEKGISTKI